MERGVRILLDSDFSKYVHIRNNQKSVQKLDTIQSSERVALLEILYQFFFSPNSIVHHDDLGGGVLILWVFNLSNLPEARHAWIKKLINNDEKELACVKNQLFLLFCTFLCQDTERKNKKQRENVKNKRQMHCA